MRVFIISSSIAHGHGYLRHCIDELAAFLKGIDAVAFVPYALADHDEYEAIVSRYFQEQLRKTLTSVHRARSPRDAIERADAVFVGGGNTFVLLKMLQDLDLMDTLRERACGGMPYVGASAGANITCPTIMTTNDMPIVYPKGFSALNLVPFNINPHYFDQAEVFGGGETRDERIREFQHYNPVNVVGVYEDSMLHVSGDSVLVQGGKGARVFRPGVDIVDVDPGADLDDLLNPAAKD